MKILQIAVGIIRNQQNEIFITQRAAAKLKQAKPLSRR